MSDAPITTMTETLQNLNRSPVQVTVTESSELLKKREQESRDARMDQAWQYKMMGLPIPAIAKSLGVSSRTVDRILKEGRKRHLEGIESDTKAQTLAGQIHTLEEFERMCLHEAAFLKGERITDASGQAKTTKEGLLQLANKQKFIKLAMDARKQIIDLYLNTGVLPRELGRMYHTMEDEGKVQDKTVEEVTKPKDRKEVLGSLLDALENTSRI